jgi:hypothetical protein
MKSEPTAWGYNWAPLSLGGINTETWCPRLWVECKADDLELQKYYCFKIKRRENQI